MKTRRYGYIKRNHNDIIIAIGLAVIILIVGQIGLAIQNNQIYKSNFIDHHTSFEANSYLVDGIYCK